MTGLLMGPLKDATGLGVVRADLAGVVRRVLGSARVFAADQPPRPGLADPGPLLARAITD